jgi:hypothetical protein
MWRIGSKVVFHNQLLFFEKNGIHGSQVDIDSLYGFIGKRVLHNDDGIPLSEWTVSVSDVERFLAGGLALPNAGHRG